LGKIARSAVRQAVVADVAIIERDIWKMKPPFLRTPYNYDRDVASDESGLACADPTLAQQQFRDEADINTILERFGRTGEVIVPVRAPEFGDFSGVDDYHAAMNMIIEAQSAFDAALRSQEAKDKGGSKPPWRRA
jgi:hypothetical protein